MRFWHSLVVAFCLVLPAVPAAAQVAQPYVPPELYQEKRWIQGSKLRFCTWAVSPTAGIDKRIAEEIGAALLLDVEVQEYGNRNPHVGDDFWEAVFIQLGQQCDAVMGFTMTRQLTADWLIPSRPYYEAPYVLAVRDPAVNALTDIPAGSKMGVAMYSPADDALIDYLSVRPKEQRWSRIPMPSNAPMLKYLLDERVEALVLWAPVLDEALKAADNAEDVRILSLAPLNVPATPIGMMFREYNVFLRDQIDQAIRSLIADGIIDQIIEEEGAVGSAPAE